MTSLKTGVFLSTRAPGVQRMALMMSSDDVSTSVWQRAGLLCALTPLLGQVPQSFQGVPALWVSYASPESNQFVTSVEAGPTPQNVVTKAAPPLFLPVMSLRVLLLGEPDLLPSFSQHGLTGINCSCSNAPSHSKKLGWFLFDCCFVILFNSQVWPVLPLPPIQLVCLGHEHQDLCPLPRRAEELSVRCHWAPSDTREDPDRDEQGDGLISHALEW